MSPISQPQYRKASLNSSCTLLQTISTKSRTVSWSESEGGGGTQRRVLVHNYSRDLWPEKQFINHSAWANVLQIALHAAAILVGVKRHNKPGWRTCSGVAGWWRLWVVAYMRLQSFGDVWNKESNRDDPVIWVVWVGRAKESHTFIW